MSSRILYNKGLVLLNLKRYKESISYFDRVIDLKQDNIADAYTSKATALDYLMEPEEAEKFYSLAEDEYSTRILKIGKEVEGFLKLEEYDKSLKLVEKILTIEPNNTTGLYLKALSLFNSKRYEESIPVFEKYLELDPNNVKALFSIGQAYFFYEKYDKAINFFDKVIDIKQKSNADYPDARYYKGNALLYLNRLSEAEEELKKAILLFDRKEDTKEKEKIIQSKKLLRSIYSNYEDNFEFNKSIILSKELIELDKDRIDHKLMLAEDYIKLHNISKDNISKADRLLNEIQDLSDGKDDESYKKIQWFLKLCSNFLDLNESNDHIGLTSFYKFFTSKEFSNSKITSKFWDFNAIKYIIKKSVISTTKKNILLELINYYQSPTSENRKNVEYLITSYLGETTIKQDEKISETIIQYKRLKKRLKSIVIFTIIGIVALISVGNLLILYVNNYSENPTISVPNDVTDWTVNSDSGMLYYVTKSGKFVEYDLKRDKPEYVSFELSKIFGNITWVNQFLYERLFPKADLPKNILNIGGQPKKLVYDENKDISFVINDEKSLKNKTITVINNRDRGINNEDRKDIIIKGNPTDIEFTDKYIYISTQKPNTLLIFEYPTSISEIKEIKTINLVHNPRFILDDDKNNIIFLVNSDLATLSFMNFSYIENNFKTIQQLNPDKYIKDINLLESNFNPIDASYNDNNNQIMIFNLKNKELISIDVSDLGKLKNNNIKEIKEKIPFKDSNKDNKIPLEKQSPEDIEIGNKNKTFISIPNTKTIYIIESNNIKQIEYDDVFIGKMNFNDKTGRLFIHLTSNNTIIPIFKTPKPADNINVGEDPFAMIHDDDNSILYVANRLGNSISMINTNNNSVINILPVGIWPNDIAFDNNANKVFVVNSNFDGKYYNQSTITIIDTLTNESTSDLTGGFGSFSLALDTSQRKIYISNTINNSVSVLDYSGKILTKIPIKIGPVGIAVNPSNKLLYVANFDDDSISIINTSKYKVIQNLTVGNGPKDIIVQDESDNKSRIFVVNSLSDTVSIIDIDNLSNSSHKVTNTISVGKYPVTAAYFEKDQNNKYLYVANSDNTISVINTERSSIFPISSIPIQAYTTLNTNQSTQTGIAVNSKTGMLYVSSTEYDVVSLYNGTDFEYKPIPYIVQSIQTEKKPYGIKVYQHTGNFYVPNLQSDVINAFSKDESPLPNINVANISYLDIDQYTGKLYVSHKYSNIISEYTFNEQDEKFQKTNTITLGYTPSCIFVDEYNSRLLVTGNNMLSIYDLHSLELIKKNISIGLSANSIDVNEFKNIIYINNPLEDEFLVLDGITYKPLFVDSPNLWAGDFPSSIAVNQKTGDIYMSNKNSDSIKKFDSFMRPVVDISVGTGKSPGAIVINPQKDRAYVINEKSDTVSIIDTISNKLLKNFKVGKYPNSIDLDIYNDDIYVTSTSTNNIYKFHDNTIAQEDRSFFNENSKILSYLNLNEVRIFNTTNGERNLSILPVKGDEIISDSKYVYVSSREGKLISRINLSDNNLTSLKIDADPTSISLYPDKNLLYILNGEDKKILILDTNKFKLLTSELRLRSENISSPDSIAVDTNLNKIYIADKDSHRIFVIDINTNKIINQIHLSGSPDSIAVNPKTHKVYGTYKTANSVFVLQNNTVKNKDFSKDFIPKSIFFTDMESIIFDSKLKSVILLDHNDMIKFSSYLPYEPKFIPKEVSIDAKSNKIYAMNNTDYIDIDKLTLEDFKYVYLPDLMSPMSMSVDPNLNKIYIGNNFLYNNNISIIDSNSNKLIKNIPFKGSPDSIAVDTNLNKIYIADKDSHRIFVIDINTNKIINQIHLSGSPDSIAVNPKTHHLYILLKLQSYSEPGIYYISIIDSNSNKLIKNIPFKGSPDSIAVDTILNKIYVTDKDSDSLFIIDGNTTKTEKQFKVGDSPISKKVDKSPISKTIDRNLDKKYSIAVDTILNKIYVTDKDSDSLFIIDGNTTKTEKQFKVGDSPISVAVNSKTHDVNIINQEEVMPTMSIIDSIRLYN